MSYPESHVEEETTLLHSEVLADQIAKLGVVAKAMRCSDDPTLVRLASDFVEQHRALLTEEVKVRGDDALLQKEEEPNYDGKKEIYIEGVTAPPFFPQ